MLAAGGIFAKCYIAQAERSSDGTQSQKICLTNLYCAHYTTKSPFCQEFFEQKFDYFAKSVLRHRLFINLYTKIAYTALKHFLYLYTKHHSLSKHSLKFFFKFIHMLSEKRRIGFGALQRTPRLDIHRRFIKIIYLRPSKR